MAVYTVLEQEQIEVLIEPFGIGPLVDFKGISNGIENTSYFLTTDHSDLASEELNSKSQSYVLTVFEELSLAELPFYIELTTTLSRAKLKVPCPLANQYGEALQRIADKPALIFPKVPGQHPDKTDIAHCKAIGESLAKIHNTTQALKLTQTNNRGEQWLNQTALQLTPFIDAADRALIENTLSAYIELLETDPELPKGIIHNDLFRDNTLFVGDKLSGIIDFYNACHDFLLLDLAITINDWCTQEGGSINTTNYRALLEAYAAIRPFTDNEREYWNIFLRICACRFWMSRLLSLHLPQNHHREGCLIPSKPPEQYQLILQSHITTPQMLPEG